MPFFMKVISDEVQTMRHTFFFFNTDNEVISSLLHSK